MEINVEISLFPYFLFFWL